MFCKCIIWHDRSAVLFQKSFYQLCQIAKVKQILSRPDLEKWIHVFITARLDYCNGLYAGISQTSLARLQLVQNSAARLLTQTRRRRHITPILASLHWLPVHFKSVGRGVGPRGGRTTWLQREDLGSDERQWSPDHAGEGGLVETGGDWWGIWKTAGAGLVRQWSTGVHGDPGAEKQVISSHRVTQGTQRSQGLDASHHRVNCNDLAKSVWRVGVFQQRVWLLTSGRCIHAHTHPIKLWQCPPPTVFSRWAIWSPLIRAGSIIKEHGTQERSSGPYPSLSTKYWRPSCNVLSM